MSIISIREKAVKVVMLPVVGILVIAFAVSILGGFGSNTPDYSGDSGPGVSEAFKVNGKKVDNSIYLMQLSIMRERIKESGQSVGATQMADLKGSLISSLIKQNIIAAAARDQGIRVTKREIADELDKIYRSRIDDLKRQAFGQDGEKKSDKELDELMQKRIGRSLADVRSEVEATYTRDMLELNILAQKLEQSVKSQVQLSDEALKDSFRSATVRHILVSNTSRPDAAARKRAEEILKQLKSGADFAKLAKEVSDDPGSASRGGLLPTPVTRTGQYVPAFTDAALQLKNPGDLSNLVTTQFGYHIIKLDSSKLDLPKDFDKKKEEYRKNQQEILASAKWMEYVSDLQKNAKLEFSDPEFEGYWYISKLDTGQRPDPELVKKAAEAFQRHIVKNPEDNTTQTSYIQLARLQNLQGKKQDAIGTLLKGFKIFDDAQARITLAQLYFETGDKDNALKQYKEAAEMTADPYIHMQLREVFTSKLPNKELAAKSEEVFNRFVEKQQSSQRQTPPPAQKPAQGSNKP